MALLMLTMMIKPCMRDGQPAYSQRPHHPQFTKLDTVWVCSKHTAVHMKHNVLCTKHSADMNETQGGVSQVGERSPTHVPRPTITPREMEEQALLNWAHTRITTITLSYQYETQSNALSYHYICIQNTRNHDLLIFYVQNTNYQEALLGCKQCTMFLLRTLYTLHGHRNNTAITLSYLRDKAITLFPLIYINLTPLDRRKCNINLS